jgi:hypothetical protein
MPSASLHCDLEYNLYSHLRQLPLRISDGRFEAWRLEHGRFPLPPHEGALTDRWSITNAFTHRSQGCIQLGAAPEVDPNTTLDMSPIDYAARAVVALVRAPLLSVPSVLFSFELQVRNPRSRDKVFHIVNPQPYRYAKLFAAMADFGYPVKAR